MDALLQFEECIRDSPCFRRTLEQHESDVEELEGRVEKVVKLCSKVVEAGQVYTECNQLFLSALAEFTHYHSKHTVIANCLHQFNQGLQEMIQFHTMLLDQSQRAITQQLTHLLSQFLPHIREAQREFVRIGGDVELAAVKNAQISQNKPAEAERASHLLLATRKCFQHFALDYCLQLNNFKVQQKLDILNSVSVQGGKGRSKSNLIIIVIIIITIKDRLVSKLCFLSVLQVFSYFHAQYTFFHQGFDLLRDLEPTMKTMASELAQLSTECVSKRKDLENQHLLVQQRDACGEAVVVLSPSNEGSIQGYLFKRSRRKNKTWKRCWFSTNNNQLLYSKTHKELPTVLFDDLRLCAVKSLDSIDRRFCFELLSVQKGCVLQADSEELKMAWINAVQSCIDLAYREKVESEHTQVKPSPPVPVPDPPSLPAALGVALRGHGNNRCCDCGEAEPRWASVNLGITVCIECSGIHRSLGVHLSKVRSLTLDSWDPEQLKLLCVLGNDVINSIYECGPCDGVEKPSPQSPRQVREVWIRKKYVERSFVKRDSEPADAEAGRQQAGARLYQAALDGELVCMARALAQGAEVNWSNAQAGRTALIGAAIGGSLLACEFLLQNGANVNYRDQHGQAALHNAATRGHTGQVCLLLKRGANQYAADERGMDPLSIAIETAHADIVTLLRMARMNEEMRDSEGFFGSVGKIRPPCLHHSGQVSFS
uniref:Arf-GAP with coiled-coil, ANK repeat and PH domain-containing protein n=1 Tax=Astyanax mexicanus TaxID=7994 RepID=A0A3B1KI71_ASTMX